MVWANYTIVELTKLGKSNMLWFVNKPFFLIDDFLDS